MRNPVAAGRGQPGELLGDAWLAVAHSPLGDRLRAEIAGRDPGHELFRLRLRDGAQGAALADPVPDRGIGLAAAGRARCEDNEVEDRQPKPARRFDDPRVGEKFLEIASHRPEIGRVGRAEINQQDADFGL